MTKLSRDTDSEMRHSAAASELPDRPLWLKFSEKEKKPRPGRLA